MKNQNNNIEEGKNVKIRFNSATPKQVRAAALRELSENGDETNKCPAEIQFMGKNSRYTDPLLQRLTCMRQRTRTRTVAHHRDIV